MANTKAAKKDLSQNKKRTARNTAKKNKVRNLTKQALKEIEAKSAEAEKIVTQLYKALDKAAKGNIIHPNKAARLKSRIRKQLNAAMGKAKK